MTPFPQDDEAKKWQALLGMDTLSAPALSDPAMQPQPAPQQAPMQFQPAQQPQPSLAPDTSHWQALAGQIPDPPTASYDGTADKAGLILAMFADAMLNKGRSMGPLVAAAARPGPDVDLENYHRQRQHALDQAQVEHLMMAGRGQQIDPTRAAIEQEQNSIARDRLKYEREALAARAGSSAALNDLSSDETQHLQQVALGMGGDPSVVQNMTGADILKWRPQIGSAAASIRSQDNWTTRNDVREQNKLDAEGRRPLVAGEVAKAQTLGRLEAANGTPDEAITNFEAANPKLAVSDSGTFRTLASNPRTAAQRQQQIMTATRALDASERLRKIEQAYEAIPFAERLGEEATALKTEYETLVTEHQGILQRIAASGAGSAQEREIMRDGIPSIHDPRASGKLKGVESMLHLNVAANLAPYGISVREDKTAPRAEPSAPASRETQTPTGPSLGVTTGSLPKVNEVPGGKVLMQLPDGRVGYVPAANVDEAAKRGARIIQ
jgi:hypothetical protein